MSLIIEQYFLTGRFHATRWNQSAFEDSHGEWPPSPYRLLRTLAARWFEHTRETGDGNTALRDRLLQRLAAAVPAFHVPPNAVHTSSRAARGLKQYQPTELVKSDKKKGEPWVLRPQTTLNVDGFAAVPSCNPVLWCWRDLELPNDESILLDQLLRRVTYFGRAESLCLMRRASRSTNLRGEECTLSPTQRHGSPVLVADPSQPLSIAILLANNEDRLLRGRRIPPGTLWMYARRPQPPIVMRRDVPRSTPAVNLLQFAVGGRVLPPLASWTRLTARFRGCVLKTIAVHLTGDEKASFVRLAVEQRVRFGLLSGKAENNSPLKGHRHVSFWLLPDKAGRPSRLICYRDAPFSVDEMEYLLLASERPIAWEAGNSDWRLRLVPLSAETPLPERILARSADWRTLTPYVPARHVLARSGKPKPGHSVEEQIAADLANAGCTAAVAQIAVERYGWLKVHRSRRARSAQASDMKLGYRVSFQLAAPVQGPLALGACSHFGLGLFVPSGRHD